MSNSRKILVGICSAAIIVAGLYFSSNNKLDGLVNGGEATASSSGANNATTTLIKNCSFDTSLLPTHNQIIISEIAWMGNATSSNDEWIELENISTSTANMGGWELVNQNEKIKVVFRSGASIAADGFYLLERGSKDFLTLIKADSFFIGTLKNSGGSFRLFDKECNLIDEVMSTSSWPAGDNTSKKTMERNSKTLKWNTSKMKGGTPKAENDQVSISNNISSASSKKYQSNTASMVLPMFASTSNLLNSSVTSPDTEFSSQHPRSNVNHILISQVQITGGKGKTNDDFIELYNPTSMQLNLKGYRLVKRAQNGTNDTLIKSWTADTFIPAYGYYLWANSSFTDISTTPDSTTSETLSNDNGIALRYGENDTGTIVDSVALGKAQNPFATSSTDGPFTLNSFPLNPSAGQSLLRKSWQNGSCATASFDTAIGNGCDMGNNRVDFELVQISHPRN